MFVNYQDWSSNTNGDDPWRGGKLETAEELTPIASFHLYLTRDARKLNTFQVTLNKTAARELRNKLNEFLAD